MKRREWVFLSIAFFILGFVPVVQSDAKEESGFVGSEACKECHPAKYDQFMKSIHGKKAIPGSPVNHEGCESCHGPGAVHVEKEGGKVGIFAFSRTESSTAKDSKCLACHEDMRGVENWNLSKHKSFLVACINCHSIHSPMQKKDLLISPEPDLCFGCHRNIRTQFNKQSHHPIKEEFVGRQALQCSYCHNPMGTFDVKAMLKADSVNDLCYKCHAEKRGPYAFEHPPVPENCLNCHEVHGSNHSRLLTRRVPLLCESCHDEVGGRHNTDPYTNLHSFLGTATSGKNRFFGRSCLNCHGNIHGSSLAPTFQR